MGQMIAALLILGTLKAIGKVDFPDFSIDIPKRVFPLPILYLCNMVSGLMSTQVRHVRYNDVIGDVIGGVLEGHKL